MILKEGTVLIYYGQENPICSVYSGGRASFMVIVHFPQLKFVFPSLLNHQALHVVREFSETLYLFLEVVSTMAQTRPYFQSLFPPESVEFSARKLSSIK